MSFDFAMFCWVLRTGFMMIPELLPRAWVGTQGIARKFTDPLSNWQNVVLSPRIFLGLLLSLLLSLPLVHRILTVFMVSFELSHRTRLSTKVIAEERASPGINWQSVIHVSPCVSGSR